MMKFPQTIKRFSFVNNYKTAIYLAILLTLPVSSYAQGLGTRKIINNPLAPFCGATLI